MSNEVFCTVASCTNYADYRIDFGERMEFMFACSLCIDAIRSALVRLPEQDVWWRPIRDLEEHEVP